MMVSLVITQTISYSTKVECIYFTAVYLFTSMISHGSASEALRLSTYTNNKQEDPRGSIVESQVLHQERLNSLPYNGLKTPN